jgi:hypothetical protein
MKWATGLSLTTETGITIEDFAVIDIFAPCIGAFWRVTHNSAESLICINWAERNISLLCTVLA